MKCDLSVIIPIYNAGQYLSKCLESILNQTMTDFELGAVQERFADIVWANEPVGSGELVKICDILVNIHVIKRCIHLIKHTERCRTMTKYRKIDRYRYHSLLAA